MRWLDLDDLVRWCRENNEEDDRETLTRLGNSVEAAVSNHLNRPLFASEEALAESGSPEHGMVVTEPIIQAARMLVCHLNENRESIGPQNLTEFPLGYGYLLNGYRIRSNP